jgi:hypothetical protein
MIRLRKTFATSMRMMRTGHRRRMPKEMATRRRSLIREHHGEV